MAQDISADGQSFQLRAIGAVAALVSSGGSRHSVGAQQAVSNMSGYPPLAKCFAYMTL